MQARPSIVVALLVFLVAAVACAQTVRFVDQSVTGGADDGTSWADAYVSLQAALTAANSGTEIRVAAGTYRPDDGSNVRTAAFSLKNGVTLVGGYAGSSGPDPDVRDPTVNLTRLSGDIGAAGSAGDNSYHVITANGVNSTAVVDGFIIASGNANGSAPNDVGGGIYMSGSASPVLRDCTVNYCVAASSGGGVQFSGGGSPSFARVLFQNNQALGGNGGAVYSLSAGPTFDDCTIADNYAAVGGGGVALTGGSATFRSCSLVGNAADIQGGALYGLVVVVSAQDCVFSNNTVVNDSGAGNDGGAGLFNDSASGSYVRCTFVANVTSDDGGAAMNVNGTPDYVNCVFAENYASSFGGAVYSNRALKFTNCEFVGNTAFQRGGGLYNLAVGPTLVNCTFSRNKVFGTGLGGGMYTTTGGTPQVRNSIFWSNSDSTGMGQSAQIGSQSGGPNCQYCCVQGWTGGWGGTGNWSLAPAFVDADGPDDVPGTIDDDLRLLPDSPCRETGSNVYLPSDLYDLDADGNTAEPVPLDLDGQHRRINVTVDLGAFEYPVIDWAVGDLNCDGTVSTFDITAFMLAIGDPALYGVNYPNCDVALADANHDGTVNPFDIQAFLALLSGP